MIYLFPNVCLFPKNFIVKFTYSFGVILSIDSKLNIQDQEYLFENKDVVYVIYSIYLGIFFDISLRSQSVLYKIIQLLKYYMY